MSDLVAFLKARLAKDAAAAKAMPGVIEWLTDDGATVVRHDPARVLREVEAKRKILADYDNGYDEGLTPGLDVAVYYLVAVYSDHPDFRQEWA